MIIWYFELCCNDSLSLLEKFIDSTVDSGLQRCRNHKSISNFQADP